jgi:hypothetical protein
MDLIINRIIKLISISYRLIKIRFLEIILIALNKIVI